MAPAAVPTVASREEEAARVVAADAVGIVASSAASEGMLGKWGVELPPVLVSRWGPAAGDGRAPRGDAPAEERGRPSETDGGDMHATNSCWTTVRDGGDGLTRSEDRRYSLTGCADRGRRGGIRDGGDWPANNSGRTTVRDGGGMLTRGECWRYTPMERADCEKGTTVGGKVDGLAKSMGRKTVGDGGNEPARRKGRCRGEP